MATDALSEDARDRVERSDFAAGRISRMRQQRADSGEVAILHEDPEGVSENPLLVLRTPRRQVALGHAAQHQVVGGIELVEPQIPNPGVAIAREERSRSRV
ncbi:MAG: hypothetical protein VCB78_01355 [Myxococcota bacterium]